jgi:hypothetical protein
MMCKMSLCLLTSLFVAAVGVPSHDALAAGSCPSSKNGKCPVQKKKLTHKRSDFTAEQRAKMMEEARKICKKRFGAPSRVHHIDYVKWRVYCTEPGYG